MPCDHSIIIAWYRIDDLEPYKEEKMNTILCLALIVLGLRSMVIHRKMKRKIKQRILEKVIANHIMIKDALTSLLVESKIDVNEHFNGIEQSLKNSIDIIFESCGELYVDKFYDEMSDVKPFMEETK